MIVSPEYQEREFYVLEITSTGSFTCWKTCSRRIGSNRQREEAVLQVLGRARSGHLWEGWSLHMVVSVNSLNKHPSQCTNTESLTKKNKDLSTKDEVLREYRGMKETSNSWISGIHSLVWGEKWTLLMETAWNLLPLCSEQRRKESGKGADGKHRHPRWRREERKPQR